MISTEVRTTVGVVLLVITAMGVAVFLLLRWSPSPAPPQTDNLGPHPRHQGNQDGPQSSLQVTSTAPPTSPRSSLALLLTPSMRLLSITFFYTGVQVGIRSTTPSTPALPVGRGFLYRRWILWWPGGREVRSPGTGSHSSLHLFHHPSHLTYPLPWSGKVWRP